MVHSAGVRQTWEPVMAVVVHQVALDIAVTNVLISWAWRAWEKVFAVERVLAELEEEELAVVMEPIGSGIGPLSSFDALRPPLPDRRELSVFDQLFF